MSAMASSIDSADSLKGPNDVQSLPGPDVRTPPAQKALELASRGEQAEEDYNPKSFKFITVMAGMYLSVFIVALDRTIVATAIPKITDVFHSLEDVGWYASAYMLTGASSNLVFGRIYQFYSTKWVFLGSMLIFEVGSTICGAAPNSIALILGRAIAGLGASGIYQGGAMIIVPLIPLRKRPIFYSLFGATFGISAVVGPLLGGAFTDKVSWRWCFYINLPIGGITILAMILCLGSLNPPAASKVTLWEEFNRLDPVGTFCFVPSIVCLMLALQWGGTTYAWSSPRIIGLLVTFAVLLIAFCVIQILKPDTATVPVRIITQRSIAAGFVFIFAITGSLMTVIYYLAEWFQAVKGDSAVHSGVSMFPMVLSMVIISVISGNFTQRIGYYVPMMLVSPILTAIGAGLFSTFSPTSNHSYWIGYQCLYGLGYGTSMQSSSLAAQTVLPRRDVSIGMALMFFAQQLGGAIFVSVSQNIFASRVVSRLTGVGNLDPQVIVNTGVTDLRNVVPAKDLPAVVNAFNYGLTRTFLVAAALSAAALPAALLMEWKDMRQDGKGDKKGDTPTDTEKPPAK